MQDLGTLGGQASEASGINDLGQVVGVIISAAGGSHAFLWTAGGGMQDLGTLGGDYSVAAAINNLGQVVGNSLTAAGAQHAFLWTAAGGMMDLGTLSGYPTSLASDINDLGQVVGSLFGAQAGAFLWTAAGGMQALGSAGATASFAGGINDLGQVVGTIDRAGASYAVLWMDNLELNLGYLSGDEQSSASGINNLGQAAGESMTPLARHPVLWDVALRAGIDVLPGDAANLIKLGGGGSVTVAILTTRYFDAAQVDPATVTLGNEDASDTPVIRTGNGKPSAQLKDVNKDGYPDLVLDFDKAQMVRNGDLTAATKQLVLLGTRKDGRKIRGVDAVSVK
jgi:probable HAF family extracellular repeat protein